MRHPGNLTGKKIHTSTLSNMSFPSGKYKLLEDINYLFTYQKCFETEENINPVKDHNVLYPGRYMYVNGTLVFWIICTREINS